MKIWIDKHGGMHYHKAGCKAIQPSENPPHFHYEEVEHQVRRMSRNPYGYSDIVIEGKWYHPCPFCFGYKGRNDG
jgi:hypothetical protein